ncbi:hypothetical protein X739_29970 [Mesorhizobium sp. LNHC220B00]|nr:hypothetical protein X739_29970 [Mesorhizobium sp. LNHC220B00]
MIAERVVFETGPLSVCFYHALSAEGLPAICIGAGYAKSALDMTPNKTDANDADGLAHLAEVGFYREVRVKGYDSMLSRTLVVARSRLVKITTELSNQICVRADHSAKQGRQVRSRRPAPAGRSGRAWPDCPATSRSLAQHARPRC